MQVNKLQTASQDDNLFYDAFKASAIGIVLENLEGQPLFVNPALCSMLGFSEEELRGKYCFDFSPAEDAEKDWALFQQLRAGSIDHYSLDKRYFRRDGSLLWGRLSISLLNDRSSPLVVAMVEDISEKRAAQEQLQRSEASLAGRLIEAHEEERRWIARELHDDINQRLSLLAVSLDSLRRVPAAASELAPELDGIRKQLEDLASDVQALSHRLHSSKLESLGLVRAAAGFCRELSYRQLVEIEFRSEDIPKDLPKDISLCLFRVLQETLQNAIKHSGSRHFEVSLCAGPSEVQLTVRDSGIGFDPEEAMKGNGLGLISIRERLKLVNGDLSIESQPQSGTTIHARVPLAPAAKSATAGH